MSQNLRVALWVPLVNPAIGNSIRSIASSDALTHHVPSEFFTAGTGGGTGDVTFADQAEVTAGVVPDEAISPYTLRREMMREFNMPESNFIGTVAISVWELGAGGINRLAKTNASGFVDHTLVELDGGIF